MIAAFVPDWIRRTSASGAFVWLTGVGLLVGLLFGIVNSRRELD